MHIEIINMEGDLITELFLESNPFKVGEKLGVSIANKDKLQFDFDDVEMDFEIKRIEHFFRKIVYGSGMSPKELFSIEVYVERLQKKRDELDTHLGNGWFTLAEKLPEEGVRVLIEANTGTMVISKREIEDNEGVWEPVWTDDDERFGSDSQVIRWRYLPK